MLIKVAHRTQTISGTVRPTLTTYIRLERRVVVKMNITSDEAERQSVTRTLAMQK